jgi:hypothetical protein
MKKRKSCCAKKLKHNLEFHNDAVSKLINSPEILGLEGVIMTTRELAVWNGRGKSAEPDAVFFLKNNRIVVVEYKCAGGWRDIAREQLFTSLPVLNNYFYTQTLTGLYVRGDVYGKPKIEKVYGPRI